LGLLPLLNVEDSCPDLVPRDVAGQVIGVTDPLGGLSVSITRDAFGLPVELDNGAAYIRQHVWGNPGGEPFLVAEAVGA
jgi:hypothetical protein